MFEKALTLVSVAKRELFGEKNRARTSRVRVSGSLNNFLKILTWNPAVQLNGWARTSLGQIKHLTRIQQRLEPAMSLCTL
jgi:hypothetical protein